MNTSTLETTQEATTAKALAGKYLTFRLSDESYGIAVLKIREIIRLVAITAVPQMPHYIKGVINLRGKVIPVVGLRSKFGLPEDQTNERTCIIVVQVDLPGRAKALMGLMVDAVEEVAFIAAQDIEDTPDFGVSLDTAYILGMAKVKGAVKSLLDIDKVVSNDSAGLLQASAVQ
jgi:purine-binding chemotaxis protein CheW